MPPACAVCPGRERGARPPGPARPGRSSQPRGAARARREPHRRVRRAPRRRTGPSKRTSADSSVVPPPMPTKASRAPASPRTHPAPIDRQVAEQDHITGRAGGPQDAEIDVEDGDLFGSPLEGLRGPAVARTGSWSWTMPELRSPPAGAVTQRRPPRRMAAHRGSLRQALAELLPAADPACRCPAPGRQTGR